MVDYFYDFAGISDRWVKTPVKMQCYINGQSPTENQFFVSVNDHAMLDSSLKTVSSIVADLLDMAVMIFITDRHSKRRLDKLSQSNTYQIGIRLPVRNLEHFQNLQSNLSRLLHHFTGDIWEMEFVQREEHERASSKQKTAWQPTEDVEVANFSGGLDSTAGLINRVIANPGKKYVLVGGGANRGAFTTQQKVLSQLHEAFPKTEFDLVQLSIGKDKTTNIPADLDFRARGLAFMLFGTVVALAHGQDTLYIYENGIGAYNLPPRNSGVGLDHSLAVHPLSLLMVSQFASSVTDAHFQILNPYEGWTKAQMCEVMRADQLADIANLTVSCDKASHGHPQCGCCSSCILRRQAFLAAGIEDKTQYAVHSTDLEKRNSVLCNSHLPAVLFGVQKIKIIALSSSPYSELARQHPTRVWDAVMQVAHYTGESEDAIMQRILAVHNTYAEEWTTISDSFLEELQDVKRAKHLARDQKKALGVTS